MNINVVCIGKLKEKYWSEAVAEYAKRLRAYCSLEITELKEARRSRGGSCKDGGGPGHTLAPAKGAVRHNARSAGE